MLHKDTILIKFHICVVICVIDQVTVQGIKYFIGFQDLGLCFYGAVCSSNNTRLFGQYMYVHI